MENNELAIDINNVWKRYNLSSQHRPSSLKSAFTNRFRYWLSREEFWALQGVSLQIKRGRTIGLIGKNGAGKSTLLRLISSISLPTRGSVTRYGRLGTLLELGAGFNYELTGRENIITGSILAGYTRKEAEARLPQVVAFAELEDFVDQPIRTYSSGMFVRLAFATEINLEPDILLVDEVLAVGDLSFQRKCNNYLLDMKQRGKTIIVVSHSMEQLKPLCDEIVWLEKGRIRMHGETREVIEQYKNRVFETSLKSGRPELQPQVVTTPLTPVPTAAQTTPVQVKPGSSPHQPVSEAAKELEITSAVLLDEMERPAGRIHSGDPLILRINFTGHVPTTRPIFQVGLYNSDGVKCYEVSTESDGLSIDRVTGLGTVYLYFSTLPLMQGDYYFSVGAYADNWQYKLDYRSKLCHLKVTGRTTGTGVLYTPHRWQL